MPCADSAWRPCIFRSAVHRRWMHGVAINASATSTSGSCRAAPRDESSSSPAPAGCCGSGARDLRFFSWHRPILGEREGTSFAVGAAKLAALADTRILLNVHRGDEPYFEWARVVEAIANGCVVASETSVGIEPLVPGVHFLMAPFEHLAEQAVALAFDEPRRMAMAEAAYKLTNTELSQTELLQAALTEAAVAAKRSARASRSAHRPRRSRPATPQRHRTSCARR